MGFFDDADMGFRFDGAASGIYGIRLSATDGITPAAQRSIQVIVRQIPEPTSLALIGLGFMGLLRKKKPVSGYAML